MNFTRLLYETGSGRARIILNRPAKRNALDDTVIGELSVAFERAGADKDVRIILLSANGPAFCSGADLQYLTRMARFDLEENREDSRSLARLLRQIYESGKPVVAVVNGPALAGGCGLASACDFIIASREHASFGYPEVRIGFIPAVVLTFLIRRVGEGRARELALRGHTLTAEEAQEIGLVNMVVPESRLTDAVEKLSDEILERNSPTAMALTKQLLAEIGGKDLTSTLASASDANASARMTDDCKRGIKAFLDKERIRW
jgi:methylglutaconyl-CoA hydratase